MRFLKFWFPVIAYSAMIFFVSAIPGSSLPEAIGSFDKVLHGVLYGLFSILVARAIANTWSQRHPWVWGILTLAFVAFYGITDEFHQLFVPGRTCDVLDWLADACGGAVGILIYLLLISILRKRPSINDSHKSFSSRSL